MNLPEMLMLASILLVGFSATGVLVLYADRRVRRLQDRRTRVTLRYRAPDPAPVGMARLSIVVPTASLFRQAKMAIGMDLKRRDPYPLSPLVLIPVSILPGLGVRWLMHGLMGSWAWFLVPATALYVVRSVYLGSDAKRSSKLYEQFPDALATIVRGVRVGIPVSEALRTVAQDAELPTSAEFGQLYDQVGIGTPLEDALRDMAARNNLPEYRFFATALALQSQTGGGLTETLENLADVVRKRVALKARGYALAAEARTSAAVLTGLPILAGVALAILSPEYLSPLLQEGSGQTVLGCGVVWLGLGMLSMRYMIRKSLS